MKINSIQIDNIPNYNKIKADLIRKMVAYLNKFGSYSFSLNTQCTQSDTDFIAFDIVGAVNESGLSAELDCKSTHYSIRRCYV